MGFKRYDLIVRQSGTRMEERTDGDFVLADEAQAEIDRYRAKLAAIRAVHDSAQDDEAVCLEIGLILSKE
jgi:hypothetical protein